MSRDAILDERVGREQGVVSHLPPWAPPAVSATVAFVGYVLLAILLLTIGLVLTELMIPGPIGAWDNSVNRWFESHRTDTWNTATDYASILAGTGTVLLVAGATVVILTIRRLWREVGFLLIALFIEFSVFLTTAMLVARPRPTVHKLDGVPATSSFPSGHVAAAVALYAGLAILISSRARHKSITIVVWALAAVIVLGVGVSRIYRGLHHPIDVFAGVILGTGAILFAVLAIRSADAASRERTATKIDLPATAEPSEVPS